MATRRRRLWPQVLLQGRRIAEPLVLAQRRSRAEALAALAAVDLHATVGVHALVSAQVRELRVGLEADLALERLHRRVDVGVLLETGRGGERFAALWTRVTPGADVMGPNVTLEVRRIGEDLRNRQTRGTVGLEWEDCDDEAVINAGNRSTFSR